MVCDHAHCYIGLLAFAVLVAGELADFCEHSGKYVGVVVGILALEHCAETLEAHSGIDVLCRKALEVAVSHTHILHKDYVPDFDDVRV